MEEIMDKQVLLPGVVVYKNLFKDVDKMLDVVKQSYTEPLDQYDATGKGFIRDWVKWYDFGIMTNFAPDAYGERLVKISKTGDQRNIILDQVEMKKNIVDDVEKIFNDYIKEFRQEVNWPEYVTNFNLLKQYDSSVVTDKDSRAIVLQQIDLLKHDIYPEKEFAIHFHSDSPRYNEQEPGFKQMLSLTIYLNDNYEGGEIQFLSDKEDKVVTYKPKAGDMTIFPSFHPFWHAALPVVSGNNKYLSRIFLSWYYDGSPEWLAGKEKYGEETWKQMESKREKQEVDEGNKERMLLKDGQDNSSYAAVKVHVSNDNDIYIDGRTL
jgi:hypothetical protein